MVRFGMSKRVGLGIFLLIGLAFAIYFTYFHKGPASDILAANKGVGLSDRNGAAAAVEDYYYYDEDEEMTPARISAIRWAHWARVHDAVVIGELYSKCDGEDRLTIGKTTMIPDPVNGGVMSRTYVNTTFTREVSGGIMMIECWYNGKDLYHNGWDLCTVEEGWETPHVIFCPITPGKHKFIKDLLIPSYAPKGRYQIKVTVTNQEEEVIGCAFTDFSL